MVKNLDFYPEDNVEVAEDFKQGSDVIRVTFTIIAITGNDDKGN